MTSPSPALVSRSTVDKYARHVNPAFVKLLGVLGYGRVFERAHDVWLWDSEGRQYLDALAGFGSVNVGHNHPRLIGRMKALLDAEPVHFLHVGPSPAAADLAERLCALSGLEVALFSTSGTEAVEAGMKLARAATGRPQFVYCTGSFHGLGLATLSVTDAARLRAPFEPLLPGCTAVPFGDLAGLERALRSRTIAAFLVEPLQAEGGVILPPAGYLRAAQEMCRRHGTLLILDEVQTGLGRGGALFAFQDEGFVPDVLVLAKSLGGGIAPIAATLTRREWHDKAYGSTRRFDLHGSTFAGSALSCAAALETLAILEDEGLVAAARDLGCRLLEGLRRRLEGHPLVHAVRGRGLLVGVELGPTKAGLLNRAAPSLVRGLARTVFGQWAALRLLEKGIVAQPASQRWDVLRLEPPLTIAEDQVDALVQATGDVLDEYRSLGPLVRDVGGRLRAQRRRRGAFA
jgi:putrescine aminotransferase